MRLSTPEAVEILKAPRLRNEIQKGRRYESRLRLFTEPRELEDLSQEWSWGEYNAKIRRKLSPEKYERVKDFMSFPLPVVDMSETLLTELYKVFDSRNSYFDFEVSNAAQEQAVTRLLNDTLLKGWIVKNAKKVFKNRPNDIVVVDKDVNGDPYLISVDSDRLYDVMPNEEGQCEYIAFYHSVIKGDNGEIITRISFYDDEHYRVFIQKDGDFILEFEYAHQIGYCPAHMFMVDEPLNSADFYSRRIPFSSSLGKMEEWSNFDTFKCYADTYGPFPVIETFAEDCTVDGCENGVIKKEDFYFQDNEKKEYYKSYPCPECSGENYNGPGSLIEHPFPRDKDDFDASGSFKMIAPETDSLEYLESKLNKIENYIELKTIGINNTGVLEKQAVNQDQVKGTFESRQNVLIKLKDTLDKIYTWSLITLAKSSIPGIELSVQANFGTEFYLVSEDELQARYNKARTAGIPKAELDMIYMQLLDTKYRGNPSKAHRQELIKLIDPLPYETTDTAIKKVEQSLISKVDFVIHEMIVSFVDRFEHEQAPLVEFGKDLEMRDRIAQILQIFKQYANEQIIDNNPEPPRGGEDGA